jgi:hypothetical protein
VKVVAAIAHELRKAGTSVLPDAGAKLAKTLARLAGDGGKKARFTEEITK